MTISIVETLFDLMCPLVVKLEKFLCNLSKLLFLGSYNEIIISTYSSI